jgi:hypothetical protein
MRSLLSRTIQTDTTFSVGLGLIVILAVAEIFAATFYYIGRARAARASAQAVAATLVRPPAPAASATSAPAQPAQSPAAVAPTPPPSLVDRLVREGVELRERGDMTNALDRLNKASENDPNNATVLEEIAKTYESMQLFDRSNEMWRKLQEMGPVAGAAYELAEQRLEFGVPTPAPTEAGASAALDAAASRKDVVGGVPEGSTFGITEVKATESPDPDADTSLTLRIGIKKQPDATVDHTKVKIQVFFYDTVDNKDIKLTDADVNYEWLTPKHDWANTNPEILSVSYLRPKMGSVPSEATLSEAAATVKPGQKGRAAKARSSMEGGQRRYLGYRILVYYNDKLQAVQAEPARLLQLYPPSESISSP